MVASEQRSDLDDCLCLHLVASHIGIFFWNGEAVQHLNSVAEVARI